MKDLPWNSSRRLQLKPPHNKLAAQGSPWAITTLLANGERRAVNFFLALCFILAPALAHARIYIQIDQPSEKKFPIAVVPPTSSEGGENKIWSHKLAEILRKDLGLTALFDLIPEDQFPSSPGARSADPGKIQFQPWSLIGAQALVNGVFTKAKDGVKIELHLYDPSLGQHLLSRTYTAKGDDVAVVAHNFADTIMKELTGEEGVFSTKITYTQLGKKVKEIGVMDMDGENAHVITKDKSISMSPAFSPDGGRIAYSIMSRTGSTEINVVGSGGGAPKRITANGGVNVSPAWTPGGQLTIASSTTGDTEIFLVNMSGDFGKKLAGSFGIDVNPAWAPDGSAFVFASERGGRLHLFRADAGGGGVQRLTFVGSQNDNPAWSPKGDKIAFQSLAGGWDIFVMNADGSMIQRLTSTGNCESPTWAPNGRFIAASCGGKVTIMREDGTNATAVGPGGSLQPNWGPLAK